jgi:ribonuclease J
MVGQAFHQIFAEAEGRVIVASFASHIHRVQQAIHIGHLHGRKFAVSGRSMVKNVNISRNLGFLKVPDGAMVRLTDIDDYPPNEILILSTGSQGEPLSALSRMAFDDHPQVALNEGDTVVISAKPIPGNEVSVMDTINRLLQSGARVVYGENSGVHVSGHASQDDLRMMLNLVRPQYLVPVHGEYRHQHIHAQLGREAGIGDERIFILENGDVLEIDDDDARVTEKVQAGMVFVDGLELGEPDGAVLRDRQQLSEDGILIAVVTLSVQTGKTVRPIELVARGFLHDGETEEVVLGKAAAALEARLLELAREHVTGQRLLKQDVHDALADHVYKTLRRRPLIMPVVVEV